MIEDIIFNALRSIGKEFLNYLSNRLNDYVKFQYNKIKFSKNIINRSKPERFEKQYIPLVIEHDRFRTKFDDPYNVFSKYPNIVITGAAGTGKSTLLKHIFISCIDTNYKIPIMIELRNYNISHHTTLEDFFAYQIEGFTIENTQNWRKAFKDGGFVFLLDGFEEVNVDLKQKLVEDLDRFINRNSKNNFVITSRSGTEIEFLLQFFHFNILELNIKDIVNFIEKVSPDKDFRYSLINLITKQQNKNLLNFLRNPLFLSVYIVQFQINPNLPLKRSAFYRSIFDHLYAQHDSISKIGFVREKLSGLTKDEIEDVLKMFSFLCYSKGEISFSKDTVLNYFNKIKKTKKTFSFENEKLLYDLVVSLCIFIKEGAFYTFLHYSFVEYFYILFIRDLSKDVKKEIYNKISTNHFYLKSGLSDNFWELSQELDEYGFTKFFILKRLRIIKNKLKDSKYLLSVFIHADLSNIKRGEFYLNQIASIDLFILKKMKIITESEFDFINKSIHRINNKKYTNENVLFNVYFQSIESENLLIKLKKDIDEAITRTEATLSSSVDEFIDLIDWK